MTQDTKEKIQLERIESMLIQDILETSDEEILSEFAEECSNPEQEIEHMKELVKEAVFKNSKFKFEAAKKARLQKTEIESRSQLNVLSLDKKRAILKAISSNDNPDRKITLAARLENDASESDLDKDLQCLFELGVIDEEGNLCEDD